MKTGSRIIFVSLLAMVLSACAGSRPNHLGQANEILPPCPDKPNCVSSFADTEDDTHFIAPLSVADETVARAKLLAYLEQKPEAQLLIQSPEYLYAEFTSDWLGFVDDVEFLFGKPDGLIHVRSASRLGYADFGVNRERIEAIRQQLNQP